MIRERVGIAADEFGEFSAAQASASGWIKRIENQGWGMARR